MQASAAPKQVRGGVCMGTKRQNCPQPDQAYYRSYSGHKSSECVGVGLNFEARRGGNMNSLSCYMHGWMKAAGDGHACSVSWGVEWPTNKGLHV